MGSIYVNRYIHFCIQGNIQRIQGIIIDIAEQKCIILSRGDYN